MPPPPPPPEWGIELRRCLDTALPTTLQKHAENVTTYLQSLNGKDAAVLGKQVLMFDEKKSLLCARPLFKPPSSRTSALKSKRSVVYKTSPILRTPLSSLQTVFLELGEPSPPTKAIVAVASHWRHCADLTCPGIEPTPPTSTACT